MTSLALGRGDSARWEARMEWAQLTRGMVASTPLVGGSAITDHSNDEMWESSRMVEKMRSFKVSRWCGSMWLRRTKECREGTKLTTKMK